MKLRARAEAPEGAEGAQFLGAPGVNPQAHHGPLQRLLAGSPLAFPPETRIASRMQHRNDDDVLGSENIEHPEARN